jgi:hypothetical protein
MRFVKGGEFAQRLHQNGERARVAIAIGRSLPACCKALLHLVHLLLGGTPELGDELPPRLASLLAASAWHGFVCCSLRRMQRPGDVKGVPTCHPRESAEPYAVCSREGTAREIFGR